MSGQILTTKLYIPLPRNRIVNRPRLSEQLNKGLHRKLTLISAPAGFGKTTLVSEWCNAHKQRIAWLSLDRADSDPTRFLNYLVAALQTIAPDLGQGVLAALQSPQPPPAESLLTILLNEITTIPDHFVLVLDDYHVIGAKPVDTVLDFMLEHLPPQMHMVITTREDPRIPLSRLRVRDELTELRAADLRFTAAEAAEFLNQVMGLNLSAQDIAALESRTEGWIAGLQLASLALQGNLALQENLATRRQLSIHGAQDASGFIKSFTGSHHFVLDYLVEQVLQQQSASVQKFLLQTSILDRLCGPLCDAVLLAAVGSGQATLEYLERANLFIVPLDNERRWYRYHQLFADLLRQRLREQESQGISLTESHSRASAWYEDNALEIEAFHHAAAANDIERAVRLMEGDGMPLHFRGAVTAMLEWLESLPTTVLNARPSLWWTHASLLMANGQTTGVEEKLQAAEAALKGTEIDDKTRNIVGQIAATRATLALTRYEIDPVLIQSRRALEYLRPDNLSYRATANVTLGHAYIFQGDRAAARQALDKAISLSQASGDLFTTMLAMIALGQVQETENDLHLATETYRGVLQLAGEQPPQMVSEAYRGLARVLYEWNDLDAAEQYGQQSLHLARQYGSGIDRYIISEVFLARLKLAQGDIPGAATILAQADQSARRHNFVYRIPEIVAAQVLMLLQQGNLAAAAHLAQTHELPISQARVHLARRDTSSALAVLESLRQQVEAKGWVDEQLKVMVLQATAFHMHRAKDKALQLLADALTLAKPGGFIRIFVDEGPPMAQLLFQAAAHGIMPEYTGKLLAVFETDRQKSADKSYLPSTTSPSHPLIEPLSQRELQVLELVARGLSNREIGERLFLAVDTVKGHNRRIFAKLQVSNRREALARAQELGLLRA